MSINLPLLLAFASQHIPGLYIKIIRRISRCEHIIKITILTTSWKYTKAVRERICVLISNTYFYIHSWIAFKIAKCFHWNITFLITVQLIDLHAVFYGTKNSFLKENCSISSPCRSTEALAYWFVCSLLSTSSELLILKSGHIMISRSAKGGCR